MARNGSGTYTKVNTFAAGTPITAASHNQNWDDVAAEITNSVAADGQTTMTGPLKASNGTAAAPAHSFGSDTDTGGYRSGSNEYSVSAGGQQITKTSSAGLDIKAGTLLINGVASAAAADGAALSILGVTGNATAPRADIAAGTDGHVLRRTGTALSFGTVATAGIADGAVTLAKQADLAAGAFIVRYTASTGAPQAGSIGSTLALNTSTGALNVAVPSAKTFLASATASTSAALSFTSLIDATYREYEFAIDSIIPATGNTQLICEVSDDGGGSWKSSGYLGSIWVHNTSGGSAVTSSSTAIPLSQATVSNSAGYGVTGELKLRTPSSTSIRKFIIVTTSYLGQASGAENVTGGHYWNGGNAAINAVRFRFSSGNIASGTITMYGIKGN